jgi:hypothetical protein
MEHDGARMLMCLGGVVETFAQDVLGARVTFAAASANAELRAQLGHGRQPCIDCLVNLAF